MFFQKIQKLPDPSKFYLNEETIDFKFNFYKYFSLISFDYKQNLNCSEIIFLLKINHLKFLNVTNI